MMKERHIVYESINVGVFLYEEQHVKLPPHIFVDTAEKWQDCLHNLTPQPCIAVDLEANSMYAYREQICLIQISTPDQDYIIDPICGIDLQPFGDLIQDPTIEKIFHASEYDLILIKQQFGWQLQNLFDTMWAARILGVKRYGLASILKDVFNIQLDKKYQKSDWCKRPLTPGQREYAQHDTRHLFRLRAHFYDQLENNGHLEEAFEIFADQSNVNIPDKSFSPDDFWSINGARKLSRRQQATLKAINLYRHEQAKKRNRPLFKVFGDRTLLDIAKRQPRTEKDLKRVHGMSTMQVRRYGHHLLRLIEESKEARFPQLPSRPPRPPAEVTHRYEALHTWRKERAQERGVESDVILSRESLWELAQVNPSTPEGLESIPRLGPWRRKTYGAEILQILEKNR